ncbi:MAG: CBS domain-containing protein, partial [Acidimicrobiales bacterium]
PVVDRSAAPGEAQVVMAASGVDWVGVRDGDVMLGWTWGRALDGLATVGEASTERFKAWVGPDTPLNEALDVIVDSRTRVAVVLDDDNRYLGMLTIAEIAEGMAAQ